MPEKITPTYLNLFERRYLPLIIVLIFVILSAISIYICYRHHTINAEQALQKDRSAAALLSLLMEERLKKIVSAMESYSSRPQLLRAVQDKNVKEASVHLVSLTKYYPDIDSLIITDRRGTLWAAYPKRPEVSGKSFAYRDWYKEVSKEWKSNISDIVLRVVGEKDIAFQISVPIFNETGQVIGILLNTQRTVGLSSLTKHLPLDPGTFITITDRKGQIAYSSRHNLEKEIKTYPFYSNIKKAIAANNKTFSVDDPVPGGRTHYISFAPVGDIGWTVLMERDKRSILLSEYAYFVQVTAIAFLLFLFIILFIVYSKKQSLIASEFAESIINTVRESLISLDQDLRVVKVSRSFYEFFKVTPEETVGKLIYDLGNKQWDIPKLRELLETILPEKATFDNYEVEHDFATIGRRIMLLNARQIQRVLGKERIILLAIEDITERREIEIGLKKAHEELEAFSYSVSHDLRAPLRGIDGWSLALLEDYKDKLDEQGRQYIDRVRKETQIMGRLIDDLLMFSRQNRAEMNQRQLDMTAMTQSIISRLQQQNPTLQADFIVQPGLRALGDFGLIEIALKNLLDNAAKFISKRSGAIIEFGQVEKEGRKAFFVRDNGVGFDMEYAHKLFGVFQRLHKASEFPGTGIGLASVQRIINRHGGSIWAEAKVNEGATFYFTLKEAT